MKTYGIFSLVLNLETLTACDKALAVADTRKSSLDDDFLKLLAGVLSRLKADCQNLVADSSLIACISDLEEKLCGGNADRREAVLLAQVRFIQNGINDNLAKRHFMVLSEEEAGFYSNPDLFGESVKEKYPARAMREIFDAGNCYAASQYTACVFHCMRVAEFGLRKLALNSFLRIKVAHNKRPCPIEYADWQKVIDAIRNKISKVRRRPVGPKREADLQFFSNAADHCEYMKDIWRNEMAHTRRFYKKEEALSVINRVKEFVTAVGEHRGSSPAEDSVVRLLEQLKREEEAQQFAASNPTGPVLPSSV